MTKMDEQGILTETELEYQEYSIMCVTETSLQEDIPGSISLKCVQNHCRRLQPHFSFCHTRENKTLDLLYTLYTHCIYCGAFNSPFDLTPSPSLQVKVRVL